MTRPRTRSVAQRTRWRGPALAAGRLAVALIVYGGAAVIWSTVLDRSGRPPLWGLVVLTGIVLVLLSLLTSPLGRLADRVAFGQRSATADLMRQLLVRMSTALPVDEVVPRLAEAAGRTVGGSRAQVQLWLDGGELWSQSWPPVAPGPGGASLGVDVEHRGTGVGRIEVELAPEGLSPIDRRLLEDLARPAGLALSTVRLTYQLRSRRAALEELTEALHASTDRILTARRGERQRFRVELSERVVPHLLAATADVGVVSQNLKAAVWRSDSGGAPGIDPAVAASTDATSTTRPPPGAQSTVAVLEHAAAETGLALDALRQIARGIYPPRLDDGGIVTSVEGWLDRAGISVALHTGGPVEALHADRDLEACLYFCVVTTLASLAGRDGRDLRVSITVPADGDGSAVGTDVSIVVVTVDGKGTRGLSEEALTAVRDRAEAFDGLVQLTRDQEHVGLTVRASPQPRSGPGSPVSGTAIEVGERLAG